VKNYNKLPFKERKRHLDYQYNQTAKQEELLIKRELKALEEEKLAAYRENYKTDKEREMEEALEMLKSVMKGGE
jgi:hypothetical protein